MAGPGGAGDQGQVSRAVSVTV